MSVGTYLREQNGQNVLPLKPNGEMHQSEAHIERGRPVQELHLVCSQLSSDVSPGRFIGFHCRQVALDHTWKTQKEKQVNSISIVSSFSPGLV